MFDIKAFAKYQTCGGHPPGTNKIIVALEVVHCFEEEPVHDDPRLWDWAVGEEDDAPWSGVRLRLGNGDAIVACIESHHYGCEGFGYFQCPADVVNCSVQDVRWAHETELRALVVHPDDTSDVHLSSHMCDNCVDEHDIHGVVIETDKGDVVLVCFLHSDCGMQNRLAVAWPGTVEMICLNESVT